MGGTNPDRNTTRSQSELQGNRGFESVESTLPDIARLLMVRRR